jgi:hypothetical protein
MQESKTQGKKAQVKKLGNKKNGLNLGAPDLAPNSAPRKGTNYT